MHGTSAKKNYDSNFCGSLPLHLINQVQAYGALLVLDQEGTVLQASQNLLEITGLAVEDCLCKALTAFLSPESGALLAPSLNGAGSGNMRLPMLLQFKGGRSCIAILHLGAEYLLIELEAQTASDTAELSFLSVYQGLKYAMAKIDAAVSTADICRQAAVELKQLSGFDKVMVYQFDEDWNGTVIAEEADEGMEAYLGLRFPASDVPRSARELYLRNPYRLIPDSQAEQVKLFPVVNPLTHGFIDLSTCNLRAVPAVHVEYLRNMGVAASMSTPIIKEGQLWGLISCHHRQPRHLSYRQCAAFELLSGAISGRLAALQSREELQYATEHQTLLSKLMEGIFAGKDLPDSLLRDAPNVLQLLGAEGVAISKNSQLHTLGRVPSREDLQELVLWLQVQGVQGLWHTNQLSAAHEKGSSYADVASGVIVLPIQPERGEFIIGFRPEVVQEVSWGGNPDDAIRFESDGKAYHPRHSFAVWKQTLRNTARPWRRQELALAGQFRNFLIEYTLKKTYF